MGRFDSARAVIAKMANSGINLRLIGDHSIMLLRATPAVPKLVLDFSQRLGFEEFLDGRASGDGSLITRGVETTSTSAGNRNVIVGPY